MKKQKFSPYGDEPKTKIYRGISYPAAPDWFLKDFPEEQWDSDNRKSIDEELKNEPSSIDK